MEIKKLYYKGLLLEIEEKLRRNKKSMRRIALLRLVLFVSLFPSIFVVIPFNLTFGLLLSLFIVCAFLWLIKVYQKLEENDRHYKALNEINNHELSALDDNFSVFNSGDEFIDVHHPYSYDMDLFGDGSLFQFLNRTATVWGKKKLALWLSTETLEDDLIINRQKSIQDLSHQNSLLQDFRASGMTQNEKEEDIEKLNEWINRPLFYHSGKIYLYLANILPALTISFIALAIFFSFFRAPAIILFLLQLFIVGRRLTHTSHEHNIISQRLAALKKYAYLLAVIQRGNYSSEYLKNISNTLIEGETSAAEAIKSLSKIVSAFDSRLNMLAAFFLEGILLWDIQCLIRLEKWKSEKGKYFKRWMESIAEFDALTSLATMGFNHEEMSYPIIDDGRVMEATEMGHILIPVAERINNDFSVNNRGEFIIITGANMAGKSTFLRTVVTNIVLAMTGAPVCASSFKFKPVKIFSSMRTSDSLNKHESYFYAELKRLKELLDRLREGEQLFIVLDEILKGTNSTDKQRGSRSALEQILKFGGTGIIATHDLELAAIESQYPQKIRNLCFEIDIDEARISFDYKLKEGVTTKMNAYLLMQQMGIIDG